ncbi:MAG: hypothetical protein C4520_01690 [Candidatus Abyssobacteria bacterium SURF_5]|uniref:Glycosyltransferase RgtA/B/C/D-like domain-containing protein n=1 Tax=Abyssobacteria bacterium (strain SURF_5) TaxID=2093360 RepID=A0A3A4PD33_ABYX5|nr:MAG: hypothetical protein C4520_01690 [Candidatus Abyssubacteria bacterium SURF_5]
MNRRLLPAFVFFSFLLACVILYEYGESFTFYFVGDDFAFIEYVRAEKASILWKPSCFYHYYPLGLFFITLPAYFDVFEPAYFTAVSFFFFVCSSILVMILFRKIAGGLAGGFLAALIYATAVPHSEVIYWKTCTSTIAMTFFSLASLFLYSLYLERKRAAFLVFCLAAYIASVLCMEQGIVTSGVLFLYDFLFHSFPQFKSSAADRRRQVVKGFLGRTMLLILLPALLMMLKSIVGAQLSPFSFAQLFPRIPHLTFETIIRLFDFNRIASGMHLSTTQASLLVLALGLVFLIYIFYRRTAAGFLFLFSSLGSVLAISLAAGGPNERYFCLPLAFFSCFLSLLLRDAAAAAAYPFENAFANLNRRLFLGNMRHILYVGISLLVAAAGITGNLERRAYWAVASTIERNIVSTVEGVYLAGSIQPRKGKKLYLVNMPSYMVNEKKAVFYICSNSVIPDLRHKLPHAADDMELVATGNLFEMDINGEKLIYRALGLDNAMDNARIQQLMDDGHLFLQFSPVVMTAVPLKAKM